MYIRSSLILLLSTQQSHVESFAPQSTTFRKTATLDAKSSKQKNKSTAKGGGFGTVVQQKTSIKKEENDNYTSFPALEGGVKDTLIASTKEAQEKTEDLSNELYDRLAQIHGFRDFNFPQGWFDDEDGKKEEDQSMSFDDLLTAGNSGSKTTSTKSDFGDLLKPKSDFLDLIADATGGSVEGGDTSSISTAVAASKQLDIENLPAFNKFRVLHVDPVVLVVDDFFTEEECDEYVDLCVKPKKRTSSNDMPMMSKSKTVGKDSLSKAQRTSTTWFHHFKGVPALMAKASRLLGLRSIDRWEEPQTVRYQQTEKFTWHLDALAPSENLNGSGGQRVATVLVYLTDVGENNGGSTLFRDLGGAEGEFLKVQPKKGSALVFFPSAGGLPNTPFDIRTVHAGEALASDAPADKWIAQLWLRENNLYKPSAPPGNSHALADEAINEYCVRSS